MNFKYLLAYLLFVSPVAVGCADLLDAEFRPLAGKDKVRLCDRFDGKVLLVVNTASKCGFTPQYEGLEALHSKYEPKGFSVVGFPSNDFMGQEPGTEAEIRDFCTLTYGVKFPMFEKVTVKKGTAVPFYDALAAQADGEYPGWNFHKYVVDRNGKVVASYGSKTKPDDAELAALIEKLLVESPPRP
ncbi:MAG TPA: glutathione peroxidase [Candidatus Saccharimonadia bacterium]|nr:glutathione peroxidase [Candidatus Saccharimonadia bacterium]